MHTRSADLYILHLFARRIGTFPYDFGIPIAIDLVTLSLVLNRGSHYEQVPTRFCDKTHHSLTWFIYVLDKGHSISAGSSALSKLNARCRVYDPSPTVVHYIIQVCTCS